jgi:hypothetical protein
MLRLTRCPAVPVKVAVEVPPALSTLTVTAGPSGVIVKLAVGAAGLTTSAATATRAAVKPQRVVEQRRTWADRR